MMTTSTVGKIGVTNHASQRAVDHFRVNPRVSEEWVRSNFRKASFVSNIVSEDGRSCRLFAYQRIGFVVDATDDCVITIYPQHSAVTPMQRRVQRIVTSELRKAERKERRLVREHRINIALLKKQRAECEWKMAVTPSKRVIAQNTKMMTQIDVKIADLEKAILDAKREKTSIAKSLITYL